MNVKVIGIDLAKNVFQACVQLNDDTIQWIRLQDGAGATVLKADPDASAAVAPGEYTLVAKVIARPKASATLTVGEDALTLRCTPADNQKVRCEQEGGSPLELAP